MNVNFCLHPYTVVEIPNNKNIMSYNVLLQIFIFCKYFIVSIWKFIHLCSHNIRTLHWIIQPESITRNQWKTGPSCIHIGQPNLVIISIFGKCLFWFLAYVCSRWHPISMCCIGWLKLLALHSGSAIILEEIWFSFWWTTPFFLSII